MKTYPENGQFILNMYQFGAPIKVYVDDIVSTSMYMGKPNFVFAMPMDGTMWAKILNKGTAKYWGDGYRSATGGLAKEVFSVLSNMPTFSLSHRDIEMEEHWKKLVEADKNQYIIVAGCCTGGSKNPFKLVSAHAYTVIGTYTYEGERLVKVRNPW